MTITFRVYDNYKVRPVVDDLNRRAEYEEFPLVVGDTLPYVDFQLLNEDENPYNLTGHHVNFYFKKFGLGYNHNVNTACEITEAVSGMCRYGWGALDIQKSGLHSGDLEITRADGRKLSMPNIVRFNVRDKNELY